MRALAYLIGTGDHYKLGNDLIIKNFPYLPNPTKPTISQYLIYSNFLKNMHIAKKGSWRKMFQ